MAGKGAPREEEETEGRGWEVMSVLDSYQSRKAVSPETHKSNSFISILQKDESKCRRKETKIRESRDVCAFLCCFFKALGRR